MTESVISSFLIKSLIWSSHGPAPTINNFNGISFLIKVIAALIKKSWPFQLLRTATIPTTKSLFDKPNSSLIDVASTSSENLFSSTPAGIEMIFSASILFFFIISSLIALPLVITLLASFI